MKPLTLAGSGLLVLFSHLAHSQSIEKIRMQLRDSLIEIRYDLIDAQQIDPPRTYDLQIFSSADKYAVQLQEVSGDVGQEIEPGTDKLILWNAKKELGAFAGELFVEIRGIITPPFVRILQPSAGAKFRPGKAMDIQWESDVDGEMSIDLYRNGTMTSSLGRSLSSGQFTLDKELETGAGYYLVFTNPNKAGRTVQSPQFIVSKGVPIWMPLAGAAVIGGVIVALLPQPDPENPTGANNDIPDPIKPGN